MYLNPVKTLRKHFLNFVRYFYDPMLTYPEAIIKKWFKKSIPFLLTLFFTGLIFYLVLFGFAWIFPKFSPYIFLGDFFWQVPIIIFLLGLLRWFGEDLYIFLIKKLKGIFHVEVNVRK